MEFLFPIIVALISNVIAQIIKPFVFYARTKHFNIYHCIACGGFPSSHSATVTGLTTAVALLEGVTSTYFAITCVFSFIVIYDAANVRYYAGKNIELTKQLISDLQDMKGYQFSDPIYNEKIKSVLGHKYIEILGGICLGILVAFLTYLLLQL